MLITFIFIIFNLILIFMIISMKEAFHIHTFPSTIKKSINLSFLMCSFSSLMLTIFLLKKLQVTNYYGFYYFCRGKISHHYPHKSPIIFKIILKIIVLNFSHWLWVCQCTNSWQICYEKLFLLYILILI